MSREFFKDTPLSEHDCQVFLNFYYSFLGQSEDNNLNLLKALSLMRQNRRRLVIHNLMAARGFAEQIFSNPAERVKILTYPSILENIWQQVIEYKRNYPTNPPVQPLQEMVTSYLTQVENSGIYLHNLLSKIQLIQPKDKFSLSIAFAGTEELKKQQRIQYQWLLIALIDRTFFCILPADATDSTMALGKLRNYVNQMLGADAANVYIEFFPLGGGILKKKSQVELFGRNQVFDVNYASTDTAYSRKVMVQHNNAKFNLAYEILSEEFPAEAFSWETMEE